MTTGSRPISFVFTSMIVLAVCAAWVACTGLAAEPEAANAPGPAFGAEVTALSRGKGVPVATRDAFGAVRDLLRSLHREGPVTRLDEHRIGLEGETRLCVEFKDAEAARTALERVRKITTGVDLLNVADRPCGQH
jgi:hypothetical protein